MPGEKKEDLVGQHTFAIPPEALTNEAAYLHHILMMGGGNVPTVLALLLDEEILSAIADIKTIGKEPKQPLYEYSVKQLLWLQNLNSPEIFEAISKIIGRDNVGKLVSSLNELVDLIKSMMKETEEQKDPLLTKLRKQFHNRNIDPWSMLEKIILLLDIPKIIEAQARHEIDLEKIDPLESPNLLAMLYKANPKQAVEVFDKIFMEEKNQNRPFENRNLILQAAKLIEAGYQITPAQFDLMINKILKSETFFNEMIPLLNAFKQNNEMSQYLSRRSMYDLMSALVQRAALDNSVQDSYIRHFQHLCEMGVNFNKELFIAARDVKEIRYMIFLALEGGERFPEMREFIDIQIRDDLTTSHPKKIKTEPLFSHRVISSPRMLVQLNNDGEPLFHTIIKNSAPQLMATLLNKYNRRIFANKSEQKEVNWKVDINEFLDSIKDELKENKNHSRVIENYLHSLVQHDIKSVNQYFDSIFSKEWRIAAENSDEFVKTMISLVLTNKVNPRLALENCIDLIQQSLEQGDISAGSSFISFLKFIDYSNINDIKDSPRHEELSDLLKAREYAVFFKPPPAARELNQFLAGYLLAQSELPLMQKKAYEISRELSDRNPILAWALLNKIDKILILPNDEQNLKYFLTTLAISNALDKRELAQDKSPRMGSPAYSPREILLKTLRDEIKESKGDLNLEKLLNSEKYKDIREYLSKLSAKVENLLQKVAIDTTPEQAVTVSKTTL